MTRTYDARTGQWRDYDSLAEFLDASDRRGVSVQARPDMPCRSTEPLLWDDCQACGAEKPYGMPCPNCRASSCPPGCTGCECCR